MKIERLTVRSAEMFGSIGVTIVLDENEDPDKAFEEAQTFINAKIRLMGDRHDELGETRQLKMHIAEQESRLKAIEELKRAHSLPPLPPYYPNLEPDRGVVDSSSGRTQFGISGTTKK